MKSDYVQKEVNTVFEGVLLEDMVDTIKRTKKMYCDVHIPGLFHKDYSHPLTYVPLYAMSLPLKKDNKVLVRFKDNDYSLPYLWKPDYDEEDIDEYFYKKWEIPQAVNGNVETPESEDTVSAQKIGDNSFIVKTDKYTVLHQRNGYILIDDDNNVYLQGSGLNLVATNEMKLDSSKDIHVKSVNGKFDAEVLNDVKLKSSSKGKVDIGNSIYTVGDAAKDTVRLIESLINQLMSLHTEGSPTAQTAAAWAATMAGAIQPDLNALKLKLNSLY